MNFLEKSVLYAPQVIAAIVLLFLLFFDLKNRLSLKQAKISTLIIVLIKILQLFLGIFLFYWQLKNSNNPLSAYLLPGKGSNYFWLQVWQVSQGLLWNLVIALLITLILVYFARLTKKPWFEKADYWVIFSVFFLVGLTGLLPVLIGSLVIMVCFQLFSLMRKKANLKNRLKLVPFLIIAALIQLILLNFSFYQHFLETLRLI